MFIYLIIYSLTNQKIVQIITKESIVVNIPENTIWVIIKFFIFASKASKTASSNIQKNFSSKYDILNTSVNTQFTIIIHNEQSVLVFILPIFMLQEE